jgi:pyruvate kinase
VELSPEKVPPIQKKIIRLSKKKGKPVVVATQMLESMVKKPTPTRAEATDVATAVYEGADAVMLSAESAVGDYPAEAVQMMSKIISAVEKDGQYLENLKRLVEKADHDVSDSIAAAARQLSETLEAAAIVTYTATGLTALRVSHKKPQAVILAMTNSLETSRKLCLAWGVLPYLVQDLESLEDMIHKAVEVSKKVGIVKKGDRIIMTCGIPFGNPGTTNLINVETV